MCFSANKWSFRNVFEFWSQEAQLECVNLQPKPYLIQFFLGQLRYRALRNWWPDVHKLSSRNMQKKTYFRISETYFLTLTPFSGKFLKIQLLNGLKALIHQRAQNFCREHERVLKSKEKSEGSKIMWRISARPTQPPNTKINFLLQRCRVAGECKTWELTKVPKICLSSTQQADILCFTKLQNGTHR